MVCCCHISGVLAIASLHFEVELWLKIWEYEQITRKVQFDIFNRTLKFPHALCDVISGPVCVFCVEACVLEGMFYNN